MLLKKSLMFSEAFFYLLVATWWERARKGKVLKRGGWSPWKVVFIKGLSGLVIQQATEVSPECRWRGVDGHLEGWSFIKGLSVLVIQQTTEVCPERRWLRSDRQPKLAVTNQGHSQCWVQRKFFIGGIFWAMVNRPLSLTDKQTSLPLHAHNITFPAASIYLTWNPTLFLKESCWNNSTLTPIQTQTPLSFCWAC